MALLLAVLALGLPFIMNGPVNDEDILTPLPTPESTVTTITEDSKITAVPTQKPVAVTTKKRTDVSPKPSVTSSGTAPAAVVSSETVKSVQDKAVNLEKVALGLYRDNGEDITAEYGDKWKANMFINDSGTAATTATFDSATGLLSIAPAGKYRVASASVLEAGDILGLDGVGEYADVSASA